MQVRLQTQSSTNPIYSGAADCVKQTVAKEGPRALYKGETNMMMVMIFHHTSTFFLLCTTPAPPSHFIFVFDSPVTTRLASWLSTHCFAHSSAASSANFFWTFVLIFTLLDTFVELFHFCEKWNMRDTVKIVHCANMVRQVILSVVGTPVPLTVVSTTVVYWAVSTLVWKLEQHLVSKFRGQSLPTIQKFSFWSSTFIFLLSDHGHASIDLKAAACGVYAKHIFGGVVVVVKDKISNSWRGGCDRDILMSPLPLVKTVVQFGIRAHFKS